MSNHWSNDLTNKTNKQTHTPQNLWVFYVTASYPECHDRKRVLPKLMYFLKEKKQKQLISWAKSWIKIAERCSLKGKAFLCFREGQHEEPLLWSACASHGWLTQPELGERMPRYSSFTLLLRFQRRLSFPFFSSEISLGNTASYHSHTYHRRISPKLVLDLYV